MEELIIFLIIAFFTSILAGAFGFGTAIILIPIASFFFEIKKAIAILTIMFISINLSQIWYFWRHVDWKLVSYMLVGAIPAVVIGAFLMIILPSELLKRVLGFVILFYIINEFFKIFKNVKLSKPMISVVSFFYGFFSGIVGTGDSIKSSLLIHLGYTKEKFIVIMGITALVMNIIKTLIFSKFSLISLTDIPLIIILVFIAIIGTYVGRLFLKKISPKLFRNAILGMLTIISFKLIIFP